MSDKPPVAITLRCHYCGNPRVVPSTEEMAAAWLGWLVASRHREVLEVLGYDYGEPWCVVHDTRAFMYEADEPVQCERPHRLIHDRHKPCQFRPLLYPAGDDDAPRQVWRCSFDSVGVPCRPGDPCHPGCRWETVGGDDG